MNDGQLLERLATTDAYPDQQELPREIWAPDVALQQIDDVVAAPSRDRIETKVRRSLGPRRLLVVAAAAGVLVLALGAALVIFAGLREDPEVLEEPAPLSPLEVVGALNQATATGDLGEIRALWADDATRARTSDPAGEEFPLSDDCFGTNSCWSTPETLKDWDGDGKVTGHDDVRQLLALQSIQGATQPYVDCTQTDAVTVTCNHSSVDAAFADDPAAQPPSSQLAIPRFTTFVIEDGRIAHTLTLWPDECLLGKGVRNTDVQAFCHPWPPYLASLEGDYIDWLRQTLPADVAGALSNIAELHVNTDTFEDHRRLIAEWRATPGEQ